MEDIAKQCIEHDNMDEKTYIRWFLNVTAKYTVKEVEQLVETVKQLRRNSKVYQYMVTFTIDPSKHPIITDELEVKIIGYLESQPDRPSLQVIECSYVKELCKSGKPHFHMKICTRKALRSDAFSQYVKVYGNVDISRSKHTNGKHIDIYMNKENVPKVLKK